MTLDRDIGGYYGLGLERDRLQGSRLELVRTLELLGRFLPRPPATVIDVGGGAAREFLLDPRFEHIVERDVREGQHRNREPEAHPEWFTTAYFHHPDELGRELEDAGFGIEAVLAVEGPAAFRPGLDAWLDDPARRDLLLRAIRRVEAEPSTLGASGHLVAVGRAPD